jgi:hypothetical protein
VAQSEVGLEADLMGLDRIDLDQRHGVDILHPVDVLEKLGYRHGRAEQMSG